MGALCLRVTLAALTLLISLPIPAKAQQNSKSQLQSVCFNDTSPPQARLKSCIWLWENGTQADADNSAYYTKLVINLGKAKMSTGDVAGAELAFNAATLASPNDPDAYALKGKAAVAQGNFLLGIPAYKTAAKLAPERGDILLDAVRAIQLSRFGQTLEDDFDKLTTPDPENPRWLSLRGTAFFVLGIYDLALKDLNKAIQISPTSSDAHTIRASIYSTVEEYKDQNKAFADYDAAIKEGSTNFGAYFGRATILADRGQFDEALADLLKAYGMLKHPAVINEIKLDLEKLHYDVDWQAKDLGETTLKSIEKWNARNK